MRKFFMVQARAGLDVRARISLGIIFIYNRKPFIGFPFVFIVLIFFYLTFWLLLMKTEKIAPGRWRLLLKPWFWIKKSNSLQGNLNSNFLGWAIVYSIDLSPFSFQRLPIFDQCSPVCNFWKRQITFGFLVFSRGVSHGNTKRKWFQLLTGLKQ